MGIMGRLTMTGWILTLQYWLDLFLAYGNVTRSIVLKELNMIYLRRIYVCSIATSSGY